MKERFRLKRGSDERAVQMKERFR